MAQVNGFDPNEKHGVEIRYTLEEDEPIENEDEELDVLNPNSSDSKEKIPMEQFILETASNSGSRRVINMDPDDPNIRCGFGPFSPKWLQVFASKKAFMIVFSILAVVQGMSWAYFTATITTLEKRFKISSQTAGIVMTGNELSQVLFSIITAYYGSHGHRPRWIATGVLFSALSCLLLASPHFFYGPGQDALSLTEEYASKISNDSNFKSIGGLSTTTLASIIRREKRSAQQESDGYNMFDEDDFLEMDELSATKPPGYELFDRNDFKEKPMPVHEDMVDQYLGYLKSLDENEDSTTTTTTGPPILHNDDNNFIPSVAPSTRKLKKETESSKRNRVQLCQKDLAMDGSKKSECEEGETSVVPLLLIFLSQFVAGIGVLLFFSLGGPYLDDNIKKTQSPMLFGVTMSLRLIGPTLGFVFGSICLKMYISPSLTPIIKPDDPRWLGAWWLGWVVLGIMMSITSVFIALFPRELPKAVERRTNKNKTNTKSEVRRYDPNSTGLLTVPEKTTDMLRSGSQVLFTSEMVLDNPIPKLSEMSKAVKSLLKNKINLYNNLSGVFYIFSAIGYWTYIPKYMETIFMQTAANASLISGFVSIAFQAIGLLLSGALISKFQPSARKLAAWNVFLGFLYVIVKIAFTQMGCDTGSIAHGDGVAGEGWNLTTSCNANCNCKVNKILPVCYKPTNTAYFSACHAGCTSFSNGTISNCDCLPNSDPMGTVSLGTCSAEGCFKSFVIFLSVNAAIKLLDSSGRIGNMLVSYRCVDPKDKSLAIGLAIFLISIFAMLPAPIVFGAIIDSVCLVWGSKCGSKGNCWLYDGERLRYVFNLTAAAFTFLGAAFDCLVWYHVEGLDLYDEDKNVANAKKKKEQEQAAIQN